MACFVDDIMLCTISFQLQLADNDSVHNAIITFTHECDEPFV